ncbi:hypothetical protein GJ496_008406 [Pomphorhynchus laevis]|nr:hypothetical protein GJ496_008406 [Pomphorhynchus laevis]
MNFTGDENQENSELSIMANSYPSSNALTRISTRCREKTISFDHIPTVHSKEQFYEDVVIFADNTLERLRFSASMYGIRIGIRILPDYLLVDLNEYISNSLSRLRNAKLIIVHSGNVDFNVYHISNDEILTCFKQTVVYLQNKTFKDECKICLSALMPLTKQNGTRKSIDDLNLAIENLCKNEKNVIFHENINRLKCSLTVGEWPRLEALSHEDVSKYQNSIDKLITSNLVEQI